MAQAKSIDERIKVIEQAICSLGGQVQPPVNPGAAGNPPRSPSPQTCSPQNQSSPPSSPVQQICSPQNQTCPPCPPFPLICPPLYQTCPPCPPCPQICSPQNQTCPPCPPCPQICSIQNQTQQYTPQSSQGYSSADGTWHTANSGQQYNNTNQMQSGSCVQNSSTSRKGVCAVRNKKEYSHKKEYSNKKEYSYKREYSNKKEYSGRRQQQVQEHKKAVPPKFIERTWGSWWVPSHRDHEFFQNNQSLMETSSSGRLAAHKSFSSTKNLFSHNNQSLMERSSSGILAPHKSFSSTKKPFHSPLSIGTKYIEKTWGAWWSPPPYNNSYNTESSMNFNDSFDHSRGQTCPPCSPRHPFCVESSWGDSVQVCVVQDIDYSQIRNQGHLDTLDANNKNLQNLVKEFNCMKETLVNEIEQLVQMNRTGQNDVNPPCPPSPQICSPQNQTCPPCPPYPLICFPQNQTCPPCSPVPQICSPQNPTCPPCPPCPQICSPQIQTCPPCPPCPQICSLPNQTNSPCPPSPQICSPQNQTNYPQCP